MKQSTNFNPIPFAASTGFTIIEAAMSILIISLVFIGSITAFTITQKTQIGLEKNQIAAYLSLNLIEEIQQRIQTQGTLEYDNTPIKSGLKISDHHTVQNDARIFFTSINQYDGWSSKPPKDQLGNDIPQASSLTRTVSIAYVDPNNLPQTTTQPTTHRLITVVISQGDSIIATQSIVLADSANTSQQLPEELH